MKRITTVLRASEAATVRKAVCLAGAERVAITPVPHRESAIQLADWRWDASASGQPDPVRLDVVVDDTHSDGVVSAILSTARVGKIENVVSVASKTNVVPHRRRKVAANG
jgi:nitrogen regulatory protein PII